MKSLLSGALLGLVSGGAALGVVSLTSPQPAGNTPPVPPQTEAPEATAETPEVPQTAAEVAETSDTSNETAAPAELAPADTTPTAAPLADADIAPLPAPDAEEIETALADPVEVETPQLETSDEEPVLPNPQSVAPQIPAAEDDLEISTAPAQAPEPVIVADETLEVVEEGVTEPVVVEVTEEAVDAEAPEAVVAPEAPEAPAEPTETVEVILPQPTEEATLIPSQAPPLAVPTDDIGAPVFVEDTTAPEVLDADRDDNNRVSAMPGSTTGVVVNRGSQSDDAETVESEPEVEIDPDAPAITRYAADFENADDKPTMSILLVDDGSLQESAAAIAQIPFPVTVVLDPTVAGAADAMAAYRAAGIEVAMKAKLPVGARPSDVEVVLEAAFATLPETVMMVETGDGNLLDDREVLAQAIAALADDGRGLLTVSQGLNTGLRTAEAAGVPAGLIFRDLDAEDQDTRVIRRFLDQAAFRARREDGVVLLARVRVETLNALLEWGNANRAGQVAIAPASVLLTEN